MKIFYNLLSFLLICFLFPNISSAETFTSISGGNFNLPSTWDVGGGATPGPADDVVIKHDVFIDLTSKKTINSLSLINDAILIAGLTIRGTDSLVVLNNVEATSTNTNGSLYLKTLNTATLVINGNCNFSRVTGNMVNAFLSFTIADSSKTFINGIFEFDYKSSGGGESLKEVTLRNEALLDVAGETRFRNSAGRDFNMGMYDNAQAVFRDSLTIELTGSGDEAGITLHDQSDLQILSSVYIFSSTSSTDDFAKIRVRQGTCSLYIQETVYLESFGAKAKIEAESNADITIGGDIVMDASAQNEVSLNIVDNGEIALAGNIIRETSFVKLTMEDEGALIFNGSNPQIIPESKLAGSGDDSLFFKTIILENTSSQPFTLTEDLIIQDSLVLKTGNIISSESAKVVLTDGALISGSNMAYVEGPIQKLGTTAGQDLSFPIGTSTIYAPITISPITNIAADLTFQFESEPPPFGVEAREASIDSVSTYGHWKMERNASTDIFDVTLHWEDSNAVGVGDLDDVIVTGWDGSEWKNYGQESAGAIGAGGYVTSIDSEPPPFGVEALTLGFDAGALLPVELKRFKAIPKDDKVHLEWRTVSEVNAKVFVVERSKDGINFESISLVNSKGGISTPAQYSARDLSPSFGWNYYRLRMIDIDGSFEFSSVEVVKFKENTSMIVYPNPVIDVLHIQDTEWIEEEVRIQIFDRSTTKIYEEDLLLNSGAFQLAVDDVTRFPSGYYVVKITGKAGSKFVNFVIAE